MQAKGDVPGNGEPGEKSMFLKHETPVASRFHDRFTTLYQHAAIRPDEPCDQTQKSGFSATGWADQGSE